MAQEQWLDLVKWFGGILLGSSVVGIFIKEIFKRPVTMTSIREKELTMFQNQINFANEQLSNTQKSYNEELLKRREAEVKLMECEASIRRKEADHHIEVMQLKTEIQKIQKQLGDVQQQLNTLRLKYPEDFK